MTHVKAGELYGSQSAEQQAVGSAWKEVGIRISGAQTLAATTSRMRYQPAAAAANGRHDDSEMIRKIEQLSGQLSKLSKEVASLRSKPH
jgi:hypothetical protein